MELIIGVIEIYENRFKAVKSFFDEKVLFDDQKICKKCKIVKIGK